MGPTKWLLVCEACPQGFGLFGFNDSCRLVDQLYEPKGAVWSCKMKGNASSNTLYSRNQRTEWLKERQEQYVLCLCCKDNCSMRPPAITVKLPCCYLRPTKCVSRMAASHCFLTVHLQAIIALYVFSRHWEKCSLLQNVWVGLKQKDVLLLSFFFPTDTLQRISLFLFFVFSHKHISSLLPPLLMPFPYTVFILTRFTESFHIPSWWKNLV